EGSEVCVFSLGGAAGEDGDEEGPTEDPELFSLGAWSPEPTDHADPLPTGVAGKGEGGAAPAWTLGASPVLLSAIESVAAAQGPAASVQHRADNWTGRKKKVSGSCHEARNTSPSGGGSTDKASRGARRLAAKRPPCTQPDPCLAASSKG
ncbi:unnamed protein product, partial [Prorocentrum cordatum]